MTLALKKHIENTGSDIVDLIDDIRALRKDVTKVMRKVSPGLIDSALDTARESASDLQDMVSDRAAALYRDAAKQSAKTYARGTKMLSRQMRDQPVATVLIAAGIGILLSRLLTPTRD